MPGFIVSVVSWFFIFWGMAVVHAQNPHLFWGLLFLVAGFGLLEFLSASLDD